MSNQCISGCGAQAVDPGVLCQPCHNSQVVSQTEMSIVDCLNAGCGGELIRSLGSLRSWQRLINDTYQDAEVL